MRAAFVALVLFSAACELAFPLVIEADSAAEPAADADDAACDGDAISDQAKHDRTDQDR